MHQPFYKDLVSGEYKLPWARLHGLKDYGGMVKVLSEFPEVRQTFNLVPSLLLQIEEYASGKASDRFLELALEPAEQLTPEKKSFILSYFFQANEERVINRFPRYAELFNVLRINEHIPGKAAGMFDTQMVRDLQILSQLAWFDEDALSNDPQISEWKKKGRDYTLGDQALMGRKQLEKLKEVVGLYREFSDRGQIELSCSAFYHPILPLICDSNMAAVSQPYGALPSRFCYPNDAEEQLMRSLAFFKQKFGKAPNGLWPSEGAVSDETLQIAARLGFQWIATDDGVLGKTLSATPTPEQTYRPYLWKQAGDQIYTLFRDRRLSDLIGFVYSQMEPREAVDHFLNELHAKCDSILHGGRDVLAPVILDGENAWERYAENGRPFLRELYGRISRDPEIEALTITEAIGSVAAEPLGSIHPGSWVDANFSIWIGAEEDNLAWEALLKARRTYDEVLRLPMALQISDANKRLAFEELLIAEGSDWCWWYGPEHSSTNRGDFDQLYRNHLANVYRLLGLEVPRSLLSSFLQPQQDLHTAPTGLIQPSIDGVMSSRGEWANAGRYRTPYHSGAMHSRSSPIQELQYGSDGQNLFVRLALTDAALHASGRRFVFCFRTAGGEVFEVSLEAPIGEVPVINSRLPEGAASAALVDMCEMRVSLSAMHAKPGSQVFLKVAVFNGELPVGMVPEHGELELKPNAMAAYY